MPQLLGDEGHEGMQQVERRLEDPRQVDPGRSGIGSWESGVGSRKPGIGSRESGVGSREQKTRATPYSQLPTPYCRLPTPVRCRGDLRLHPLEIPVAELVPEEVIDGVRR